ncbi:transaldolase [Buchnera aphidicola (Mollitrichosiphum nigrofasciatum)]|uniref:transaldolase n=1 Tax=Buchnera aphidicola TaxID=9 RepID=UPI0031B8040C
MNMLKSLQKITSISIDTGDINIIKKYNAQDATTNPSLILNAVNSPYYKSLVLNAISYAKKKGGNDVNKLSNASDKLLINVCMEILKIIPGYVSIEIDARCSFNTELSVIKALKLISMLKENGVNCSRILIKLAATWECIKASEILQKEGIKCNLTLLFSFAQAVACAESNVFLISPFIGRIYDWFCKNKLFNLSSKELDPGVLAVQKIYKYYKKNNYKTIIMGASFRNIQQILNLAGCDKLTISPMLMDELQSKSDIVVRKLSKNYTNNNKSIIKNLSESEFRWIHNNDPMAVEKLSEGIRQFGADQIQLENFLFKQF